MRKGGRLGNGRFRVGVGTRPGIEAGSGAGTRTETRGEVGIGIEFDDGNGVGVGVRTGIEAGSGAGTRTETRVEDGIGVGFDEGTGAGVGDGTRTGTGTGTRVSGKEMVESELSSIVLGFPGGSGVVERAKLLAIHCDGGHESRAVIQTLLHRVIHRQFPCILLAQLLQLGFVHLFGSSKIAW